MPHETAQSVFAIRDFYLNGQQSVEHGYSFFPTILFFLWLRLMVQLKILLGFVQFRHACILRFCSIVNGICQIITDFSTRSILFYDDDGRKKSLELSTTLFSSICICISILFVFGFGRETKIVWVFFFVLRKEIEFALICALNDFNGGGCILLVKREEGLCLLLKNLIF